jgi:hypothetical protein
VARRDRKRSCGAQCCGGCLGVFVVALVVFSIWYSSTGSYQPHIPPPPLLPNPNAFNDYVTLGQMLKANGGTGAVFGGVRPGAPSLAAEKALVARNQAVLSRLRLAMANPGRVPSSRSYYDVFPYLADMREMARLLAAEEDVLAAHGDYAGSFSAGIDGIRVAQDIGRGGTLIHGLVSLAMQAIVRQTMIRQVDRLTVSQCAGLAARLRATLLARPAAIETLENERDLTLSSLSRITDSNAYEVFRIASSREGGATSGERQFGAMAWHFMRDRTLKDIEAYHAALQREAARPASKRAEVPEPKSPIAAMLMPVFAQWPRGFDDNDTRNRLLLCMLRIREYQLTRHKLPSRLDALGIEPTLLVDPYTGATITYLPKGDDYLLYCLGPDGRDDGGVPANESSPSPFMGDIGVRPFRATNPSAGSLGSNNYRRVPHMLPPKVPPGSPPLTEW